MAATTELNIKPGSQVRVEIVKLPSNAAARKTLVRLLAKDDKTAAEQKKNKIFHARSLRVKGRGGRPWEHHTKMRRPVTGVVGEAGTFKATLDVIRDLGSVSRFVKVSAAK